MSTKRPPAAGQQPVRAATRRVLRLPLPLAARLAAWCEMHPQRPRDQIAAELLAAGLAQAEREWSARGSAAAAMAADPTQPIYLPAGPFARFQDLVLKHHLRLEHERDHDAPASPSPHVDYLLDED